MLTMMCSSFCCFCWFCWFCMIARGAPTQTFVRQSGQGFSCLDLAGGCVTVIGHPRIYYYSSTTFHFTLCEMEVSFSSFCACAQVRSPRPNSAEGFLQMLTQSCGWCSERCSIEKRHILAKIFYFSITQSHTRYLRLDDCDHESTT